MSNKQQSKETRILNMGDVELIKQVIENTIHSAVFQKHITKDMGTCIIGEGIEADVMLPRKRKARTVQIFTQRWTQGDQPKAVRHLITIIETLLPEYKGLLRYNCGRMD